MPAFIAVDAGEAFLQIAAVDETIQYFALDAAMECLAALQLVVMVSNTLIERAIVYGYLNRIQSSRRLEREAGRNVELMWLLGRLDV